MIRVTRECTLATFLLPLSSIHPVIFDFLNNSTPSTFVPLFFPPLLPLRLLLLLPLSALSALQSSSASFPGFLSHRPARPLHFCNRACLHRHHHHRRRRRRHPPACARAAVFLWMESVAPLRILSIRAQSAKNTVTKTLEE